MESYNFNQEHRILLENATDNDLDFLDKKSVCQFDAIDSALNVDTAVGIAYRFEPRIHYVLDTLNKQIEISLFYSKDYANPPLSSGSYKYAIHYKGSYEIVDFYPDPPALVAKVTNIDSQTFDFRSFIESTNVDSDRYTQDWYYGEGISPTQKSLQIKLEFFQAYN
jgi:hypothetical protein